MEIQVNHLLIHELEKEPDTADANLFLTDTLLPVDERARLLVGKLNATFLHKDDTLQGFFDSAASLAGYFGTLAGAGFAPEAFLTFSQEAMKALKMVLQGVIGAKGGYLVFADYLQGEQPLVGIFLVRDTEGVLFRKDQQGQAFQLDTITYLNTEKLAMACRIDIRRYREERGRYLEVIKHARSQKEISEYFLTWIGMERPESSRDLSQTFLQVVEELPLPVDEETGEVMAEGQFRKQVFNYVATSPSRTIDIEEFDQHFYGEQPVVKSFLEDHQIDLDPEFRFDRSVLKQVYKYRAAAEGISLSFSHEDFSLGRIRIEGDEIVIHSPEMIQKIRDLL